MRTFPGGALPPSTTTGGSFDSNFSRSGLVMDGSGSSAGPWGPVTLMGNIAECWVHFRMYFAAISLTNANTPFQIQNSAGQGVLRLQNVSTANYQMQYWNGSAWTNVGSSVAVTNGTFEFDVHSKIDNSTGIFEIFINGVSTWSFSGDTDLFSGSANDRVLFDRFTTGSAPDAIISEIIIATTDTRSLRVATLVPNGAGASTAWTGTFADVDETDINDADFVSATTAPIDELFTLTDLSTVAQGYDPVAVTIGTRGRVGVTGPSNLQTLLRTGSTDYNSSNKGPTTSFASVSQTIYDQNPNTTADWTISDIQGLEVGVRSIT